MAPNYTEVLWAAQHVFDAVLSKPVRLRHGYLDEQARQLSTVKNLIDDFESAVNDYVNRILPRISEDLIVWWLIKLVKQGEILNADPSKGLFSRRFSWICGFILGKLSTSQIVSCNLQALLLKCPLFLTPILASPQFFKIIDIPLQDTVLGNLIDQSSTSPSLLVSLKQLKEEAAFTPRQEARFSTFVQNADLNALAHSGLDLRYYITPIITKLKSHDWYTQNPAVSIVRNAGPTQVGALEVADQFRLGNNILQSAEGSANKAVEFLGHIKNNASAWPIEFIRVIWFESFVNDEGKVRFKKSHLGEVASILAARDQADQVALVNAAATVIEAGSAGFHHFYSPNQRTELLATLAPLEPATISSGAYQRLANSINGLPIFDPFASA